MFGDVSGSAWVAWRMQQAHTAFHVLYPTCFLLVHRAPKNMQDIGSIAHIQLPLHAATCRCLSCGSGWPTRP
jgi:hypothetical protein